jgi:hypothetical protein
LVYLYGARQVLVGLPQRVGGLANIFYFILGYFYSTYQVLVGQPQGVGGLAILLYILLYQFIPVAILFYFHNAHQVGARKAPPRCWWSRYFILV